MIMTTKLANELMDMLACVAISATGGIITDKNGNFNQEQMAYAKAYAQTTFCELLEAWEELTGKKWEIEVEE